MPSELHHLTTGLPLREANHFGVGSVEVSAPPKAGGEGGARRLAITAQDLLTHPHPTVKTVPDILAYAVRKYGDKHNAVAWRDLVKMHDDVRETIKMVDGEPVTERKVWKLAELTDYKKMNYVEFSNAITEVRNALLSLGISKESVVNIYASTGPTWQFMNHACAAISTAIATAYDTLGVEGLTHSLNEPECIAIFTNAELLTTLAQVIPSTPHLKHVFFDGNASASILSSMKTSRPDITFTGLDALRALGRIQDQAAMAKLTASRAPTPDTTACIMYTSGSTGNPKGVVISHANLLASVSSVALVFGPHIPAGDIYLAYLPLAHVLEYIVELCALYVGITCGYARPKTLTDAGVKNCRGDLIALKPHIMFGVPGVWETIRKGVVLKLNGGSALKKALFYAAMSARSNAIPILSTVLEKVVLSKVREATGGNLKFAMNGGAPISRDTREFLSVAIMPMMEGYGMTESCGMCALLPPEYAQHGSVGLPVPSIEIKLLDVVPSGYLSTNPRPQGEICIRGPSVFKGYYKRPDLNEDPEIWTADGWFRTGDVGMWNEDGTLSVIDRIKNLVKMQTGEYIALERLESIYKSCDFASNFCVHVSNGAATPIGVLSPHEGNIRHAIELSNDPAIAGLSGAPLAELCENPFIKHMILHDCNTIGRKYGLKGPEILSAVVLTPEEWTPETGLVTAAMKVKRSAISHVFDKEIKAAYL